MGCNFLWNTIFHNDGFGHTMKATEAYEYRVRPAHDPFSGASDKAARQTYTLACHVPWSLLSIRIHTMARHELSTTIPGSLEEVTVATGRCQQQELVRLARITRGRRLVLPLANRRRSGLLNGRHTMEPTPCNVIGLTSRPTHPDNLAAIPYLLSQPARRSRSPPTIVNYLSTNQEVPAREVRCKLFAEDSTTELQEFTVTRPVEDSQRPAAWPASTGDWLRRTPALNSGLDRLKPVVSHVSTPSPLPCIPGFPPLGANIPPCLHCSFVGHQGLPRLDHHGTTALHYFTSLHMGIGSQDWGNSGELRSVLSTYLSALAPPQIN
ncbi:hypothetical protein CTAM01_01751 [Colletotrichum tamarilloi]|nr:uncharacterized protein CTAM01_01751 [Colletotrichum tamarilloi]KAK1509628.1 hypothetical protein CTAM01_01751 [Colletotrichum tamarilloi]